MKILTIGNSFSVDATAYLPRMARISGIDVVCGTLFIGGCSLERHWNNICNDTPDYIFYVNGEPHENYTVERAVLYDNWDIVVLQQASHLSGVEDSYFPYTEQIFKYVKDKLKDAKVFFHETWAYDIYTTHYAYKKYDSNQTVMYNALKRCYGIAAEKIGVKIIPSGDVIQRLRALPEFDRENGGQSLNLDDGSHMHTVFGRYAVSAVWYEYLCGGNILSNDFLPDADELTERDLRLLDVIKRNVHSFLLSF